jgi:hypothetical protein
MQGWTMPYRVVLCHGLMGVGTVEGKQCCWGPSLLRGAAGWIWSTESNVSPRCAGICLALPRPDLPWSTWRFSPRHVLWPNDLRRGGWSRQSSPLGGRAVSTPRGRYVYFSWWSALSEIDPMRSGRCTGKCPDGKHRRRVQIRRGVTGGRGRIGVDSGGRWCRGGR